MDELFYRDDEIKSLREEILKRDIQIHKYIAVLKNIYSILPPEIRQSKSDEERQGMSLADVQRQYMRAQANVGTLGGLAGLGNLIKLG